MNFGWAEVPISDSAIPINRSEQPSPGVTYRQAGVRLWGGGAYERAPIDGGETQYKTLNRTEKGDIVVNKIWARNGSVSVIPHSLEGCYVSTEFPLFKPIPTKLEPEWFYWITKTRWFWNYCDFQSRGTSGKNRIRPEKFLAIKIPLPPLAEQQRIVAKIERLAAKIEAINQLRKIINDETNHMLLSTFRKIVIDTKYVSMSKAAPIVRRPVNVVDDGKYLELGIRSFGNGTFHKPALSGLEVGSKRVFYINPGDLLFSNVFAWEGAIAVAQPSDAGRVGSHRFITCVPCKDVATPEFLCFYFLTPEGMAKIGNASPGGAGRNRTLGLDKLEKIEVPVPDYQKQLWFNRLQASVREKRTIYEKSQKELDALLPSILDKAFKGKL